MYLTMTLCCHKQITHRLLWRWEPLR